MSTAKALVIACLLVLPGVVLRAAPHAQRFVTGSAPNDAATVPSDGTAQVGEPDHGSPPPSRRLSQRSRLLLALGFAAEVGLHAALIVLLLRVGVLVSLFEAVPLSGRVAIVAFFTALMAGFLGGHAETFPFLSWRMYSGQGADDPVVYVVDGERSAGDTVKIDLQDLVPAVGRRRLNHIIRQQAEAMQLAGNSVERERRRSHQQLTLLALGRLYNVLHPADRLARIRLAAATVPLDATAPPWLRHRRELVSVDLDPRPE